MMLRHFIIVIVIVLIKIPCIAQDEYKLVWSDEFADEGAPDPEKWNYDTKGNAWRWGNNELQYYTDAEPKNALVSDGCLKITALKEKHEDFNYTSARLTTKGKGDWLYGKIKVRAKVPGGLGLWPAIWMLPTKSVYGAWPNSGEIDIMEYVGFDPNVVHFTVHTEAYNHKINTQIGSKVTSENFESEFHVFELEWLPQKCIFLMDGKEVFTFTKLSDKNKEWPFDQPFHLLLNVAVGGSWGGTKGLDESIFPKTMLVDYVRIYQK